MHEAEKDGSFDPAARIKGIRKDYQYDGASLLARICTIHVGRLMSKWDKVYFHATRSDHC